MGRDILECRFKLSEASFFLLSKGINTSPDPEKDNAREIQGNLWKAEKGQARPGWQQSCFALTYNKRNRFCCVSTSCKTGSLPPCKCNSPWVPAGWTQLWEGLCVAFQRYSQCQQSWGSDLESLGLFWVPPGCWQNWVALIEGSHLPLSLMAFGWGSLPAPGSYCHLLLRK